MVKADFIKILLLFSLISPLSSMSAKKEKLEGLELFNKVLYLVETQYYRDVDSEKLIQGALKGMMNTLDPHSTYLGKEVFQKIQEDTRGEFGGLGIEVTQKDGVLVVITPIEDTPAFKAGIKSGDKIMEINNESTVGITLEEAVEKMRGKPDTEIKVGIVREGVQGIKEFTLVREIIKIRPVKSYTVNDHYILLRLTQFQKRSAKTMVEEIKRRREEIKDKTKIDAKGVILDLRSNPGGLLEEAINVSSIFLHDGVVVSTEGRDPKNKEVRYVKKSGHKELTIPLVVLINGASASASEIVAGALQDSNRAIIMGTRSFGKGSVQTVAKIEEQKGVKLTIAQYMTPKGRKIQAIGIDPDVEIRQLKRDWRNLEKESSYIREKDLRNHLTATIETAEEKKLRMEREKEERITRVKKIKEKREKKKDKGKDKPIYRKYDPKDDYQLSQAVSFLQNLKVFKKIKEKL